MSLFLQHQCTRLLDGGRLAEQGFAIQVSSLEVSLQQTNKKMQVASDRIMRAFGKLAELYKDLSKLLATSTHVCELVQVLDAACAAAQPPAAHGVVGLCP